MKKTRIEWDEGKDRENQAKHDVSFSLAQRAFLDPHRVIAEDVSHTGEEDRFYCIGRVDDGIVTVRFTYRGNVIRIFGRGYWRGHCQNFYENRNMTKPRSSQRNTLCPPKELPPHLPLSSGRCEKMGMSPLTLPSPARGEGEHIEIKKLFPPPRWGRGKVGVIWRIISQLPGMGERVGISEKSMDLL